MGKIILILIIIFSISCATFRHNTIPIATKITSLLEEISDLADKSFDKTQRQSFAKSVMLPAIEATEGLRGCLASGECRDLAAHLTKLSQSLLIGINIFASQIPNGTDKDKLIGKLQSAIAFVTDLYNKISHEETPYYSYPEMVIQ